MFIRAISNKLVPRTYDSKPLPEKCSVIRRIGLIKLIRQISEHDLHNSFNSQQRNNEKSTNLCVLHNVMINTVEDGFAMF